VVAELAERGAVANSGPRSWSQQAQAHGEMLNAPTACRSEGIDEPVVVDGAGGDELLHNGQLVPVWLLPLQGG
jgi:hypothetical protein